MTAHALIAREPSSVKEALVDAFRHCIDCLFEQVDELGSGRALEMAVWDAILSVGRELLTTLLASLCWRSTRRVMHRGARLRMDGDYWLTQTTTLGQVHVPLFAFRDDDGTHAPARDEVFPQHPRVRSSELCLEWETRLGAAMPLRLAQESLTFFTHGATKLEDTTIGRHLFAVGDLIDREWMWRTKVDIREILRTRATRDQQSGRPLVYVSTDAHALRRYVDETWAAPWKMLNGLRVWCIDRRSGQTIHLGGEYTWGDCHEVAAIVRGWVDAGYLPQDGDYGDDVFVQYVCLTDGILWIRDHVYPEMPEGTVFILDFYHAMQHVAAYAAERFGAGTKAATSWFEKLRSRLLGKRRYRRKSQKLRKGHKKTKRRRSRRITANASSHPHGVAEEVARELLSADDVPEDALDAHLDLIRYLAENADRMDYPQLRARGMQVGSGAMESLHRIASQARLKLPGVRWKAETARSVLRVRMMMLAGRWEAFWSQEQIGTAISHAAAARAAPEAA